MFYGDYRRILCSGTINRAMTRNDAKYKNPDTFDPERFLDGNGALTDDEVTYVFGFGRWCVSSTLSDEAVSLNQRQDTSREASCYCLGELTINRKLVH